MTDTLELAPEVMELIAAIDKALVSVGSGRNLIPADEMTDLLLDIRRIVIPVAS